MKALHFDGALKLIDMDAPRPAPGEALVRLLMAGVCNTDVEIARGYMGFRGVPGHEFVGVVESAPDPVLIGSRVVGGINSGCGECESCRRDGGRHCPARDVLGILGRNGALAEKLVLPARNLHLVPPGLSDEKAVFTEPLAACFRILEQVEISARDRVAVVGDGKLGSLAALALRTKSPGLTVVGRHESKMRFLREAYSLNALPEGFLDGRRFDVVVECSGNPTGLELATRLVRPEGTIVLKSTYHGAPGFDFSRWVIDEIRVVGSRCGAFPPALEALAAGTVDPLPLIEEIFPFSRALEAFAAARRPGARKALMRF